MSDEMGAQPQIDVEDYPAVTYQHVMDLTDTFGGLPAVPVFSLRGLHEIEALIEALVQVHNLALDQVATCEAFGYPVVEGSQYPGTGVQLVVNGPGQALLMVVGTRRMEAKDVPAEVLVEMVDGGGGNVSAYAEDVVPHNEEGTCCDECSAERAAGWASQVLRGYAAGRTAEATTAAEPLTLDDVREAFGYPFDERNDGTDDDA